MSVSPLQPHPVTAPLSAHTDGGEAAGASRSRAHAFVRELDEAGRLKLAASQAPGGIVADWGIGNPLALPPSIGIDARVRALREDLESHHYAPKAGLLEVSEAAVEFCRQVDDVSLAVEQVMVSECGTAWLLRLLAEGILKSEGPFTAVVPAPHYGKHVSALQLPGVKLVLVDYLSDSRPYAEVLRTAVEQHRPRVIVDSAVRNPTTTILEGAQQAAAVEIARENGAILFMDDAYRHIYRSRRAPIPSVLSVAGAMESEVLATLSFSKGFRWPGLRGGLVLGNPRILTMIQHEKDMINEGGDPSAQMAMSVLMQHPEILAETRRGYDHACPTIASLLRDHGWDTAAESDASMFLYIPVPSRWAARGLTSAQLSAAAANRGVVTYHDTMFGGNGSRVRVCMRGNERQWKRAAEILGELVEKPETADFSLPR